MKITSAEQFETLIAELEKSPCLAKGFQKGTAPANFKQQWEAISSKLNALEPPLRDSDGWQKVWRDYKFKHKKKLMKNKAECNATGGGIYKQLTLCPLEEAVANLLQFNKQLSPEGILQGVQLSPAETQHRRDQPSTPARTRKPKTRERNDLFEWHNRMQERILTDATNKMGSMKHSLRDTGGYLLSQ